MSAICPKCNKDDMVQKVSAIYSGGISSVEYSGPIGGVGVPIGGGQPTLVGGTTRLSGTLQTMISKRLAPPSRPKRPSSCFSIFIIFALISGGSLLAFSTLENSSNSSNCVGAILSLVIFWGLAGLLIVRMNSTRKKNLPAMEAADRDWQSAMESWNNSYYCWRDDFVFVPTNISP